MKMPWHATFTSHRCNDPMKQPFGWNVYSTDEEGSAPVATAWGSTPEEAKANAKRIEAAIAKMDA